MDKGKCGFVRWFLSSLLPHLIPVLSEKEIVVDLAALMLQLPAYGLLFNSTL